MQGVLLLYLYYSRTDGGLGVPQASALGIVGAYGSTVYLSTLAGAWVADRLIGSERVLLASAVLVMTGHACLALVPGATGVTLGLSAVALGSGGLKANTTAILGGLNDGDSPAQSARRDSAFALFYLGVNLGSLLGPTLTGLLQITWGFQAAFGAAAAGMAYGLGQYLVGRRRFADRFAQAPHPLPAHQRRSVALTAVAAATLILTLVVVGVVRLNAVDAIVFWAVCAATVGLFTRALRSQQVTPVERRRVRAFIPMFAASSVFWALSQQQFTVLTVYADRQLDRRLFGWEMPVSWVQTINPVFVVACSGAFAVLWDRLGSRQPTAPTKFALSNLVMGAAFLLFIPLSTTIANSVPLLPVIGILALFSIAELALAPVGLALAARAAPKAFASQMVALFYLSIALGTSGAGLVSTWYSVDHQVAYFAALGLVSLAVGAALLACSRRLAHTLDATDNVSDQPTARRRGTENIQRTGAA